MQELLPDPNVIAPNFGHALQFASEAGGNGNDEQVTAGTIRIMARLVREDATDPVITSAAEGIRAAIGPAATERGTIEAAYWYVKNRVRFVGDEQQIEPFDFFFPPDELLIRPSALLSMARPSDDCDGFSMLLAAILRALDQPSSFKTVAANRDAPGRYSHVYLVAHLKDGSQMPLDASHGPGPGLEVRPVFKSRVWPIEAPMKQLRARRPAAAPGLGAFDWTQVIAPVTDLAKGVLIPRYGTPPPPEP